MPDDTELLEQRVTKQKQKLEQAAAVVSMVQDRLASVTTAEEEAGRELRTLRAALKSAQKKAKRLKKRTEQASALSGATEQDRLDAERELSEELRAYEKRQAKLAKAEAALAAAMATQRVEDIPAPEALADMATPGEQGPAPRKTTPARKRTAAAKKTTSTTGRTASTASTAKKASTTKKASAAKTTAKRAPARKASTRQPRKTT